MSKLQKKSMEEAKAYQRLIRNDHRREGRLKAKVHSQDEVIIFLKHVGQDTEPSEGDRLSGSRAERAPQSAREQAGAS